MISDGAAVRHRQARYPGATDGKRGHGRLSGHDPPCPGLGPTSARSGLPVLAEEVVEGLVEQGVDGPALHGAERA